MASLSATIVSDQKCIDLTSQGIQIAAQLANIQRELEQSQANVISYQNAITLLNAQYQDIQQQLAARLVELGVSS